MFQVLKRLKILLRIQTRSKIGIQYSKKHCCTPVATPLRATDHGFINHLNKTDHSNSSTWLQQQTLNKIAASYWVKTDCACIVLGGRLSPNGHRDNYKIKHIPRIQFFGLVNPNWLNLDEALENSFSWKMNKQGHKNWMHTSEFWVGFCEEEKKKYTDLEGFHKQWSCNLFLIGSFLNL